MAPRGNLLSFIIKRASFEDSGLRVAAPICTVAPLAAAERYAGAIYLWDVIVTDSVPVGTGMLAKPQHYRYVLVFKRSRNIHLEFTPCNEMFGVFQKLVRPPLLQPPHLPPLLSILIEKPPLSAAALCTRCTCE